jgi:transcriptional regulator with XRE-family HTH domain
MTPDEIKKAIKKNNTTQKAIAEKLGVAEMSVSYIVNKKIISNRIMQEVARTIGKDPCKVFPEYYLAGPKHPRRTSNVNAAA